MPYGNNRVVHVYGGGDAYVTLMELARQWQAAGQPDLTHCQMHITPAGRPAYTPEDEGSLSKSFTRPDHTYTLWMIPPQILAE